jgi:CheY-like chemotaxis protein
MVITGGLDMLRRTTDPDRRQMLMDGMLQAAERGAGLTRQLLAFSRRQSLQPQPIDLAHQIEGMRQLLDRSLRGNVHVSYELDDDLWAVKVDPGELELVILNLAVNARDAMPSGGTITIRASNGLLDVGSIQGEFVSLSVIDTGIGMSAEIKDRVFEPYFTTKEVGKGSGLGLAQVYGFAQQSGGGVEIESEVGRGTTVRLVLPRSYESPTRHAAHADGAAASRRNACLSSVLLVEDNEEVAALVREMFLELGYEVTRVASAKAALGALANGRRVDIVFSDIMMPGDMDGLELAREIHMRRPNLPIVLTSGYTQRALREAEAQGLRILRKPYRIEQLAHTITAALEASQLRSIAQNSTSL